MPSYKTKIDLRMTTGDFSPTGAVDLSGASSVNLGTITTDPTISSASAKLSLVDGALTSYVSGNGGYLYLYSHSVNRAVRFGEQNANTFKSEINTLTGAYRFTAASNFIGSGTGSPEGVLAAPVGSLFLRTDSATTLYIKQTGTGNTGWVAK